MPAKKQRNPEETDPQTHQEAIQYFSDPDACLQAAIALRWGTGPVTCPTCGSTDVHFIATRRIWRCRQQHERRQFSVKVGTVMEDSPIGLDKWMVAIWLLANCKNGISSYDLARDLDVTQKTGWFLLHRIRLAMQAGGFETIDGGNVEVDETYIGGKARNMHVAKRKRMGITQGRSMAGKIAVLGLLDSAWQERCDSVPRRSCGGPQEASPSAVCPSARRSWFDRQHGQSLLVSGPRV